MLLTLATFAFAAELRGDHPSTYTVRKGDTLWEISARFLKKPWLWPEIWQANPQVKNPHLIYPGDVLSLVYIDGRAQISGPQVHSGDPIETIPLSRIEPFLKQLTIVNDVKSLPYVIGLEEQRLLNSSGQVVYVRGLSNATPGQQVQLMRPINSYYRGARYTHRNALDFRGDEFHRDWATYWSDVGGGESSGRGYAGTELMLHSTGEVTQVQGEVAVVLLRQEVRDVRVGDRVLPLDTAPYDAQFMPTAPTSVAGDAHILAVSDGVIETGPYNVVALSVGASDNVRNGMTFSVWHQGEMTPDVVRHRNLLAAKGDKVDIPDEFNGHVMVFRTFDKVSYGLVMDGIRPIKIGDVLKHPDATQ
ncbi:hypothetical protein N789_06530 [Arenimonas oryziterrae DSM 21050 = YC6267]|uniref:LysM domain-containing protein n=2 Tax=Arenimonas TaxID=490567 RepID=A0A091AXA2_9GAMM|nr:hypothetical protein N789_06530 [Arenimonas oryziterrae DSM 21050 = YC6267]